jgi:pSer/pThr/pTyr-binding forkhead associated (FHA) protein
MPAPPNPPDDPLLGANAFQRDDARPTPPKVQRTPTRKERVVLPGGQPQPKRRPTLIEPPPTPKTGEVTPAFRPRQRPPMALLTVYDDGRHDGQEFRLRTDLTVIGRTQGDVIIPHDERMSGRHAEIRRAQDGGTWTWVLADLGSTNGTYVRLHKCSLKSGQELLIGHRRFRFEDSPPVPAETTDTKKTAAYTVPATATNLIELTSLGDGRSYPLAGAEHWIGSAPECSVALDDPMIADHHARLSRDERGWRLESHEARDGVWLRIDKPVTVDRTCSFQLGEQRFLLKVL